MRISRWFMGITAVFGVIFFISCDTGTNSGGGGGGGGDIVAPNNPPSVTGGSLGVDSKAVNAIKSLDGYVVTPGNVDEFIEELVDALGNNVYDNTKSARNLPEEYYRYTGNEDYSYTGRAYFTGSVKVVAKGVYEESWTKSKGETESGYTTYSYIFDDYSNSGTLFLGGAVGELFKIGDGWDSQNRIEHYINKANGKINFDGNFKGTIHFENVTVSRKYQYDANYNNRQTLENQITAGKFYVKSVGGTEVSLPIWLINEFYPRSKEYVYPNGDITITGMPQFRPRRTENLARARAEKRLTKIM